jgi:hypothetical protein
MNKEEIYDAEIGPLMSQIIETCKTHGIAMVACYAIPTPEDAGLRCTSHLANGEGEFVFAKAAGLLHQNPRAPTMMLTKKDKDGNVTEMTAILG